MPFFPADISMSEVISFFIGPSTLIIAFFALRQVREMRKQNALTIAQITDKEEKESFQKAIDLCEKFRTDYLGNYEDFSMLKELQINKELKEKRPETFSLTELSKYQNGKEAIEFLLNDDNNIISRKALNALNFFEFFAMNFVSGIASKEIAFAPLHRVFLDSVELFYPYICMSNRYSDSRLYNNTISLYKEWLAQVSEIAEKHNAILQRNEQLAEKLVTDSFAPTTRRHKNTPVNDTGVK